MFVRACVCMHVCVHTCVCSSVCGEQEHREVPACLSPRDPRALLSEIPDQAWQSSSSPSEGEHLDLAYQCLNLLASFSRAGYLSDALPPELHLLFADIALA